MTRARRPVPPGAHQGQPVPPQRLGTEGAAPAGAEARWAVRAPAPPHVVDRLSQRLGVPPLLASMLWSRGLIGAEHPEHAAAALLQPSLEPLALPGLEQAARRLERSLRDGERILVHGDYDADGMTGTAILTLGLRRLGARVATFLPNRLTHGYGLHPSLIERHADACELFVTVDCGIGNVAEVAQLRGAGVDVIVTDHHTPGDELPDATIVHPGLRPAGEREPGEPTGAGVAFHLLWTLHQRLGVEAPLEFTDLAALGTVADVAPLLGANRAIVHEGLRRMLRTEWPGLRAMVSQSHLRGEVTARDLAFVLAPRLNAAGRLGEPEKGLELLVTGSERTARELAVYLDARNDERRRLQDSMFEEAVTRVDPEAPAIVVADDDWHPGVMGIVASKLLERFYRPVFIVAREQGSVRSTPGISAVEALRAVHGHLRRFGGHTAAAGFALDADRLPAFERDLQAWMGRWPRPVPELLIDAVLSPERVDQDLWRAVQELEPYGEGHAAPRFALCDRLDAARAVGQGGHHLQLRVAGVKGVAWRMGSLAERLHRGQQVHAAVALRENVWKDRRTLEFVAEAVREARPLPLHVPGAGRDRGAPLAPVRRGERSLAGARHLKVLPLGDEPLSAHQPLAEMLHDGAPLAFELDPHAQRELLELAARYPTVHELRRAFVSLRRGHRLPFEGVKADLVLRALRELDLLDARDLPRANVQREPYTSPTLRAGLLQRYRLDGFLCAYRHLDEPGFERTVHVLFGGSAGPGATERAQEATNAS